MSLLPSLSLSLSLSLCLLCRFVSITASVSSHKVRCLAMQYNVVESTRDEWSATVLERMLFAANTHTHTQRTKTKFSSRWSSLRSAADNVFTELRCPPSASTITGLGSRCFRNLTTCFWTSAVRNSPTGEGRKIRQTRWKEGGQCSKRGEGNIQNTLITFLSTAHQKLDDTGLSRMEPKHTRPNKRDHDGRFGYLRWIRVKIGGVHFSATRPHT